MLLRRQVHDGNLTVSPLPLLTALRDRSPYREQPSAVYDERQRKRVLHGLRKRAQSLGFDLLQLDSGLVLE